MKKNIARRIIGIILMISIFFPAIVNAADITPSAIPDEEEYGYSGKTISTKETWSHIHNNNAAGTDTVSHSVSRTRETTFKAGAQYQGGLNLGPLVQAQAGVNFEVSVGVKSTVTTQVTFTIPQYTKMKLSYGNRTAETRGYYRKYSNGKLIVNRYTNVFWTYGSYSSKNPI